MKEYVISEMRCCKCGKPGIPVPRINGRYHKGGHLKKLWCFNCQEEVNHCEIRGFGKYTHQDFDKEFNLGRFVNGERIAIKDLELCNEKCLYNISGKCWNANRTFKCEKRGIK